MPTVEEQMSIMQKGMGDLAEVVRDIARHVYKNDGMYDEEEDYEVAGGGANGAMHDQMDRGGHRGMNMGGQGMAEEEYHEDMALGDDPMGGMPPEDEMPIDPMAGDPMAGDPMAGDPMAGDPMAGDPAAEDPMVEDPMLEQMARSPMMRSRRRVENRGYANVAVPTADEEDSPFDEQQDSIEGNEVSPAGAMGGDRADETFNANFMAINKRLERMERALRSSGVIAQECDSWCGRS